MKYTPLLADDLAALGACATQVAVYRKQFPKGLRPLLADVQRADNAGMDVEWFVVQLSPQPLLDEYNAKRQPIWDEYDTKRQLLRDEYATKRQPLDEYIAKRQPIWDEYDTKRQLLRVDLLRAVWP